MNSTTNPVPDSFRHIFSVSHLNDEARDLLEGAFPLIWVEGEISNFSVPGSGHWYLTLKDEKAQIRSVMFRMRNMHVGCKPRNGMQVLVRARLSLYTPRGDCQLIIEHMEEAGNGALRRAYEALKQRLDSEGLFDPIHKAALPPHPTCIGVVTSPTGAAIHDVLSVLKRRFPAMQVIVYPVTVQGTNAARAIATMIDLADQRAECDLLIVGRGGGSLEDLWPFNEESVARAIHRCSLPVISAVGHEIDFTIADFVADVRAPTPSAAAELISPDAQAWQSRLSGMEARLLQLVRNKLGHASQSLLWLCRNLHSPQQRLQLQSQRLDDNEARLLRAQQMLSLRMHQRLTKQFTTLERNNPLQDIRPYQQRLTYLVKQLLQLTEHPIHTRQGRLAMLARALDAVSPLATLRRGYAIVERPSDHKIITHSAQVEAGDEIDARLASGRLRCRVQEVLNE